MTILSRIGSRNDARDVSRDRRRTLGYLSGAPRVSTLPEAPAGGPRSHVLGVIRGFEALGWDVRAFIAGNDAPHVVRDSGEEHLTGAWPKRLALDLGRIAYGQLNRRRALKVVGDDVEWVYERFASFQSLGRVFQRSGVPWIVETQGPFWLEAHHDRRSLALRRASRRTELAAYRRCDILVCVSEVLRDLLIDAGVAASKILVVPNAVDLTRFRPGDVEPLRASAGPTIIFAGALMGWQRLDVLMGALAQLMGGGGPSPFQILVLGDGPERKTLEARARAAGVSEHVHFLGRVSMEEVPRWMAGSELGFVGHSRVDGAETYHSPLKLYEYLAMGLPVIAARTRETEGVLTEGRTGFFYEPGDRQSLAHALSRAAKALNDIRALGRLARAEATNHSWRARVEMIVSGVEHILATAHDEDG